MTEPFFQCVASLGDVDPYKYGGAFVLVDRLGKADPMLIVYEEDTREAISFDIERGFLIKDEHGQILGVSFNNYNSRDIDREFKDLWDIANFSGVGAVEFAELLCDIDVVKRASAWLDIYRYWGRDNVGGTSETLDRKEARRFCDAMLKEISQTRKESQ